MDPNLGSYDPIAIALDGVILSDDIRFAGIDLETGRRMTIAVRCAEATAPSEQDIEPLEPGLVLLLIVQRYK
jgi:hypothetical protein